MLVAVQPHIKNSPFYFCMNNHTLISAQYFENSVIRGLLHGNSPWKAAFLAGQYMDVLELTYLNEEVWKAAVRVRFIHLTLRFC